MPLRIDAAEASQAASKVLTCRQSCLLVSTRLRWQEASRRWSGLAVWLQAFDGYALAAQALDQLKFSAAMSHKCIVQELASTAGAEGRRPLLGVVYDDVARCGVLA